MRAEQLHRVLAGISRVRRIHSKYDAVILDRRLAGSPFVVRPEPNQNRFRPGSLRNHGRPFRIAIDKECS